MNTRVRVVFVGCVKFSKLMFDVAKQHPAIEIVGIASKSKSAFNSDFESLLPDAKELGIPYFDYAKSPNQSVFFDWMKNCNPQLVLCLGWSHLLPPELIDLPQHGVVGYHPALLPRNRGRHPIIWTVALGLKETASTFFLMDQGADSGAILSQVRIILDEKETAASLYHKLASLAGPQLNDILSALGDRMGLSPTPQNHALATYWRKRSPADGKIDWRMSANAIDRLVRALSWPYPGAEFCLDDQTIKVWHTRVVSDVPEDEEPGKVLSMTPDGLMVKCGQGAIILLEISGGKIGKEARYL